jgi:uncharacterized protein YqeY
MQHRIQDELKKSMKERNELRTSTLRMLISDMKYAQIEKRAPLEEADILQVIRKSIKKRKESAELYQQGGRPELASKEQAEAAILQEFLPADLDEATARGKIEEIILELGAMDKKGLGRVMKEVMARYKGQIDGKLVQKIVSEKLNG